MMSRTSASRGAGSGPGFGLAWITATGGFWVGSRTDSGGPVAAEQFGFNGWIDEVRYQTFNPIAAGAFEPTAFLIVPEPTLLALLPAAATALLVRPRRRARA